VKKMRPEKTVNNSEMCLKMNVSVLILGIKMKIATFALGFIK